MREAGESIQMFAGLILVNQAEQGLRVGSVVAVRVNRLFSSLAKIRYLS